MSVSDGAFAEVDHDIAVVFLVIPRVVPLATPGIHPRRVGFIGVNAVQIIQETVHHAATSVAAVAHQPAPKILLRLVFKRF